MTFEFEYLGKFSFIFENFLDYETGSQMGSIDEKKLRSKISCKCTFKPDSKCLGMVRFIWYAHLEATKPGSSNGTGIKFVSSRVV